jgi:hypothetical protein
MKKLALLLIALSLGSNVFGNIVTIEGTTSGSFAAGVSGMGFTGGHFSWVTDAAGNGTVNLGSLSWASTNISHVNNAFSLNIAFDDVSVPASMIYTADVWANWNGFNGFCDVWFDDVNPTHFTYSTDEGTGAFDFGIKGTLSNGYSWESFTPHRWFGIGRNSSVQLTGIISNATFTPAPIPEPATLLTLGLSLLGMRFKKQS